MYEHFEDKDAKNKPSYQTAQYTETQMCRDKVIACSEGERGLKAGGVEYLPPFALEMRKDDRGISEYDKRLANTTTYPALSSTLDGLVGIVFHNAITLVEDDDSVVSVPPEIVAHWDNIDNQGTKGNVFAQEKFYEYLRDGYTFIVVDLPQANGITNATEERRANLRPYWCSRTASQAISWRFAVIKGNTKLSQIVFCETKIEPDGEYGEKEVVYYSTWKLAPMNQDAMEFRATLKVEVETKDKDGRITYTQVGETVTLDIDELPISVIGNLGDYPHFEDLADLNIRHRRQDSDYMSQIPYAGVVGFVRKGVDVEDRKTIEAVGSRRLFDVPADGDFSVVETTGAAMAVHKEALKDLKDEMASLGLSTLLQRGTVKTATEITFDSIKDNSQLALFASEFKDGIERALWFHAQLMKLETGGTIQLGANLTNLVLPVEKIRLYSDMVTIDQLPLEELWAKLQSAGELPDDFDKDAALKTIEKRKQMGIDERAKMFERGQEDPQSLGMM